MLEENEARRAATLESISRNERAELASFLSNRLEAAIHPNALRLGAGSGDWGSHYDFELEGLRFHVYRLWEGSFHGHVAHLWWLMPNGQRRRIEYLWNFEEPMYDQREHEDECERYHPKPKPLSRPWWRRLVS